MRNLGPSYLATREITSHAIESALTASTLKVIGRVTEVGHIDLAISLTPSRLAVIRCVDPAAPENHTALPTVVDDGDFVWAGLVYSERPNADWPGGIEAFHVSELPRLIERLQELQRAPAS